MILKTFFCFTLVVGAVFEGCYQVCLLLNSQNSYAGRLNLELLLLSLRISLNFTCTLSVKETNKNISL